MARDNDIKTNNPTDRVPQSGGAGIGGGTGSTGSNIGGRTSSSAGTSGTRTFRCADAGYNACPWEVSGRTDEELRPQIEQHGRQHHGIKDFGEDMWNKVRGVIRERRAA
jgi:predicted small metal-binding protein